MIDPALISHTRRDLVSAMMRQQDTGQPLQIEWTLAVKLRAILEDAAASSNRMSEIPLAEF